MKSISFVHNVIIVTGAAGFIGANLIIKLLNEFRDITIVGVDNINDYYDVSLKEYRLGLVENAAVDNPGSQWFF